MAVAANVGWMYTYSGVSAPDDERGTPDPTVGAVEISGSRGWGYVTSRECTTLPVFASMILKQSLPWLRPKCIRRGTRWYASLQNGKTGINGRPPKNTSFGESMPLFAVVAERLNLSDAHKTDSIHKLEPSGSRTPLSLLRRTSGKNLLTSSRAACPALIALRSLLSLLGRSVAAYMEPLVRGEFGGRYSNQRTSSWCTRRRCWS